MRQQLTRPAIGALLLAVTSCGSGPSTPATSTPTTPTPTPTGTTWSVAGQLVATGSHQVVPGAQIAPAWSLAPVTTGTDGGFQLGDVANPPTNPYPVSIAGAGLVTHDVWIGWQRGPRTGVTLDVIRNAAPFSMDFYRQLVRGTYDVDGAPYPVLRWMQAPKFYVRTIDQNGRPIEPEVVKSVLDAISRAVPAWTGNTYAAVIESGTDARPSQDGWINVDIRRDPNERRICGFANVGANPGSITLNDDVCSCGSNKIPGAVTMHEVAHALGFFHVSDRGSLMFPFVAGDCPAGALSSAESLHAAIAYSRPRGNTDPDHDPASTTQAFSTPLHVR